MKYIGAHVSISGGVENAPVNAHRLGATAFAMFTKNQRQWSAPPLSPESIAAFRANCEAFGYRPEQILPHDTYLINLGQPDPEKRKRSLAAFVDELARCRELGLVKLNFHPGSHLKEVTLEEELRLIAASVREAVDTVPEVIAVFESILAAFMDNFGWQRRKAALVNCIAMLALSMPCVLGYNLWSDLTLIGGRNVLDTEDFLVSNLLLPLGSLIYLLFCVSRWGWSFDNYIEEANCGKGLAMSPRFRRYFMFVLPFLIILILIQGLI